jgi:hypothetical protein
MLAFISIQAFTYRLLSFGIFGILIFTNSIKVAFYYLISLWVLDIIMEWLIDFINKVIDKISKPEISFANFISGLPERRSIIVTFFGLAIIWYVRIYISFVLLVDNTIQ